MPRQGFRLIVVLTALMALVAAPQAADAKKKKKKPKSPPVTVVSNTQSTVGQNQLLTVTASCPAGKIAVGGGFSTSPVIVGVTITDLHFVYESRRASNTAWQASVARYDSSTPGNALPITTSVDCRTPNLNSKKKANKSAAASKKKKKKKLKVTEVSASQTAPTSPDFADATATCPAGTQALSGGFSISPPPAVPSFVLPWASYRSSPNAWRSALTNGASTPETVTSYAYCAAGLKISEVSGFATLGASGPGYVSGSAASGSCPKGKALLSGGFNNTPPTSGGSLALLQGSSAVGSTWQVSALNLSPVAGQLGSFGYCA
jgi:hypothetical protein